MTTAVATQQKTFKDMLSQDSYKQSLAAALPKHVTADTQKETENADAKRAAEAANRQRVFSAILQAFSDISSNDMDACDEHIVEALMDGHVPHVRIDWEKP